ncbi:MAG: hypothetical protein ACLSV2_12520 [Clostridium sp.]
MKKYNQSKSSMGKFNFEDNSEDFNGICDDTTSGVPISSFDFDNEAQGKEMPCKDKTLEIPFSNLNFPKENMIHHKENNISANFNPAPPVMNEELDIQRSYKIRKSTARMLNEIKAIHPDVNIYMNIIVDAAIRNYHDFIFNRGGRETL